MQRVPLLVNFDVNCEVLIVWFRFAGGEGPTFGGLAQSTDPPTFGAMGQQTAPSFGGGQTGSQAPPSFG